MSDKKYVNYEDFGAVGDGVTDDFDAIEAAHNYANANGLEVKTKSDATYYVGEKLTREIQIKTNVDWNGSHFIIDDSVANAYANRGVALFGIRRDVARVLEGEALIEAIGEGRTIKRGDTVLEWLAPVLTEDSFIRVVDDKHRDFVRFGSNENKGCSRHDLFEITKDGVLDPDIDIAYEFDNITRIVISPAHETPITVKNGNFASICCRTVAETEFLGRWHGFYRGIVVERADVTIENLTHKMLGEPELDTTRDELAKRYGNRGESYPYVGFIVARYCNRITVKNCLLTSRTTYYEDKPATVSTGWKVPAPVPLGSYDMYFISSNHVSLINVKQNCPTGIGDSRYWGIMASNNCKKFLLDGCYMNRFDAHQGFWGATIINSTIGHSINITGGGRLYMENVTKITGTTFLSVRGDYGASFEGEIIIKNCRHECYQPYISWIDGKSAPEGRTPYAYVIYPGILNPRELYYNWDFGYELYLPKKITLDNFTVGTEGQVFILPGLQDDQLNNTYKHFHHPTEEIVLRNMSFTPKLCDKDDVTIMNNIPLTVE